MKRVLVVDDDAAIRTIVTAFLERAGYWVRAVSTVKEALATDGPWDLLLLDRRLPNGDGLRVAQRWPDVPRVTSSGYEPCDLPKPFTGSQLLAALTERIGA